MIQKSNLDSKEDAKKIPYAVKFLDPIEIINQLEILPDMTVAHFGCGTGFFTFPIARKIGENGKIYALDILEQKIEIIESQAKLEGLSNIIAKRVSLENEAGSKLENESADWIILTNMLYQNEKKDNIIKEAKRVLKNGGKILLIDWENLDSSIGPQMKHRVSKDELKEMIMKNDLSILKEIETSNFHFGWILKK